MLPSSTSHDALMPICYKITVPSPQNTLKSFFLLGTIHSNDLPLELAARLDFFIGHFVRSITPSLIAFEMSLISSRLVQYYGVQSSDWDHQRHVPTTVEQVLLATALEQNLPTQGMTDEFAHNYAIFSATTGFFGYTWSSPTYRKALIRYPAFTISMKFLLFLLMAQGLQIAFIVLSKKLGLPVYAAAAISAAGWVGLFYLDYALSQSPTYTAEDHRKIYTSQGIFLPLTQTYTQTFQIERRYLQPSACQEIRTCCSAREELWVEKILQMLEVPMRKYALSQSLMEALEQIILPFIEPLVVTNRFRSPRVPSSQSALNAFAREKQDLNFSQSMPQFPQETIPLIAVGCGHLAPLLFRFAEYKAKVEAIDLLTGKSSPIAVKLTRSAV